MAATICDLKDYLSRCLHTAHFIPLRLTNSFNRGLVLIVTLLVTFLQLKFQGSEERSPFVTHPKTMRVAVSSSVICFLAYVTLQKVRRGRFVVVAQRCLLWSGYMSVASLLSLFFWDALRPFLYGFFAVVSESELLLRWLFEKLGLRDEGKCYFRRFRSFLKLSIRKSQELPRTLKEAMGRD